MIRDGEIILTVYPSGEIGLRELRRRTEFKLGLADAWRVAIDITNHKFKILVAKYKKAGKSLKEARQQARKELGLKKK